MYLIPAQSELTGDGFLAGRLEQVDGEALEHRREAAGGFGPRKLHGANAVLGAPAARRYGLQDGPVLAGVQVPPTAGGLAVMERAQPAALRARPLDGWLVRQMDVDFPIGQLQFHAFHAPRL